MATTEASSIGQSRSSRVRGLRLAGLGVVALLAGLCLAPAAIAATPSDKDIKITIDHLQACVDGNADSRPVCSAKAIKGILDRGLRLKAEAGCAKESAKKPGDYVVISAQKCIDWLAPLKVVEAKVAEPEAAPAANATSVLDSQASPVPAVKEQVVTDVLASAAADTSAMTNAVVLVKAPAVQEDSADSGIQPLLFWLVTGLAVLLLLALLIGYLKFSGDHAELQAQLADSERELAKRAKENQQLQESILQSRREVPSPRPLPRSEPLPEARSAVAASPPAASAIQRPAFKVTATGDSPAPVRVSVPEAVVAKPERPVMTHAIVQEAILSAIASLANDRSSLTEANFVNKVAGFATDAGLKALLLANLEPALFFLCSGSRSPQGPELVVYRFKGLPDCSVVPYPSAGRVGQFNRWFENAGSPYGVSPVLAIKAAVGVIGADGNLSVSALGVLA